MFYCPIHPTFSPPFPGNPALHIGRSPSPTRKLPKTTTTKGGREGRDGGRSSSSSSRAIGTKAKGVSKLFFSSAPPPPQKRKRERRTDKLSTNNLPKVPPLTHSIMRLGRGGGLCDDDGKNSGGERRGGMLENDAILRSATL